MRVANMRTQILSGLVLVGCLISSGGCSAPADNAYLTPISDATIAAYRPGPSVRTKLDAVLVGRLQISSTRLDQVSTPRAIFVQEMTFAEANRKVTEPLPQSNPMDSKVWLVIFQGTWQLMPPDPTHTVTPPPPYYGCVYALFYAEHAEPIADGGTSCPP